MAKAWSFKHLKYTYIARAAAEDEARQLVAKHDAVAAQAKPEKVSKAIVKFFGMKKGDVVTSGVFGKGER